VGLNDFQVDRNLKVTNLTAGAGELSQSLLTASLSGRAPLDRIKVQNLHATDPADVGFVAGGPYARVKAGDTMDLGSVGPGDRTTLFYIRAGAADAPLRLLIWG